MTDHTELPKTRKEAIALGSKLYYPGKECKNGHIDVFSINDGCETCRRERARKNTAKYRVKVQAPLRENGVPTKCPWCNKTWLKPYGSTARYCCAECQEAGYKASRVASAKKPENKERKSVRSKERFAEKWQDPDFKSAEIQRSVAYRKARRQVDPGFRIRDNLSTRINMALKAQNVEKSFSTLEICGCTTAELALHLESQFQPGMSWDNRSEWHIDHIRPCASFDLTDPEQQKECFHYTNLQPLWGVDNIRKGAKWEETT